MSARTDALRQYLRQGRRCCGCGTRLCLAHDALVIVPPSAIVLCTPCGLTEASGDTPTTQLTRPERERALRMLDEIGVRATCRTLGVGVWSLDRLVALWVNGWPHYHLRPSIVTRVRERLVTWERRSR